MASVTLRVDMLVAAALATMLGCAAAPHPASRASTRAVEPRLEQLVPEPAEEIAQEHEPSAANAAETDAEPQYPCQLNALGGQEPAVVVLVVDRSGSMTGPPMKKLKEACREAAMALDGGDWFAIVAFDSRADVVVKLQPAGNQADIQNSISKMKAGGGTEMFTALSVAHQLLAGCAVTNKRVVLVSDGKTPTAGLIDLTIAMRRSDVVVSTVGIGPDADTELLKRLATAGGGSTYLVTQLGDLPLVVRNAATSKATGN
jgi:Mg-chelatase subunit ChlD